MWQSGLFAILANAILGASSIYWALFRDISPITLVEYRVIFSLIVLFFVLAWSGKIRACLGIITLRLVFLHTFAAVLVAINWGTFIWASINGSVLESGFGYLIAPIFTIALGSVLFREKISRDKSFALLIIVSTILFLILSSGRLEHWVYLTIAVTWGGYTVLKKKTTLSSIEGLFVETLILSVLLVFGVALQWVSIPDMSNEVFIEHPLVTASGIVSVVPLVMFSIAAQKLNSYNMGMLQFFLPSVQLVVSFLYFGQVSTAVTYLCFFIIWVTLFTISLRHLH